MSVVKIIITVIYIIAALTIIGIVLMQEGKSAGLGSIAGAGGTGSGDDSYWSKIKGRSLEGKLEQWTKITAGLFLLSALLLMLMK